MRRFVTQNWKFLMFILVIVLFIIWIGYGREKHDFIGLDKSENVDIPISILPGSCDNQLISTDSPVIYKPVKVAKRSKGEAECMSVLHRLFGKPFDTVRPDFLKSTETGRNLELDCYNDELKLSVEYNGIQHYNYPSFPGFTKEQFYDQIRRDRYKR